MNPFVMCHFPAWMDDALCAHTGHPDAFFPSKGGSSREAKAICRRCPVRAACLEYAMVNREQHGIWGALTDRERAVLRRARAAA